MKKAEVDLLWNIVFGLILMIFLLFSITWLSKGSDGEFTNADSIAKQTALLIENAKPSSVIFVDARITIEGNKVKAFYETTQAEYQFYSKYTISAQEVEGGTEIKIE